MIRIFPLGGVISSVLILIIIIIGFFQPDHNGMIQTISELASTGQPNSAIVKVLFFISGVSFILFSFFLRSKTSNNSKWLWSSFIIIGFCSIIGSIFSIDKDQLQTFSSIIHLFSGLILLIFSGVAYVSAYKIQKAKNMPLTGLLLIGIIGLVGIMITIFSISYTGLGQRLFYISFIGFLVHLTRIFLSIELN